MSQKTFVLPLYEASAGIYISTPSNAPLLNAIILEENSFGIADRVPFPVTIFPMVPISPVFLIEFVSLIRIPTASLSNTCKLPSTFRFSLTVALLSIVRFPVIGPFVASSLR